MSNSHLDGIAENAANIENIFNSEFGYQLGEGNYEVGNSIEINNANYDILADYNFNDGGVDYYQKAVVLQNKETGEIYFHFNGTNDGSWEFNSAAYGAEPQPSKMQKNCLLWFDMTMEKLKANGTINDSSSVYVTGHSQGGNNAMFVAMRSKYIDDIDSCVPLDGPGFSNKFVDDTMAMYGKDEYNSRCNKIWAYNGEHDYVSILGQKQIVPDDHVQYVEYVENTQKTFDLQRYHIAEGLIDKNGKMTFKGSHGDSEFRQLMEKLTGEVTKLPQEEQVSVANTIMALIENSNNKGDFRVTNISTEDLRRSLRLLVPTLAEFLKDNPNEIGRILTENIKLDQNSAFAVVSILDQYGNLDRKDREDFLNAVIDLIKIENNAITIDYTKLSESYAVIGEMFEEMVFSDADTLRGILNQYGVTNTPAQIVAVVFLYVGWKIADEKLEDIVNFVDTAITVFEKAKEVWGTVTKPFVEMFESLKVFVKNVKSRWREKTNRGISYVKNHPSFSADPDKLRNYAARLNRVNDRLKQLDTDMNSVFWQVGFLDLLTIIRENIIISKSVYLKNAAEYLNNTANRLENADNKAKNYMGG